MQTGKGYGFRLASLLACAVAVFCLGSARVQAADGAVSIRGAGATFPAPLYAKWIDVFHQLRPDVTLTYEGVGSGEGISRFLAGGVDFSASDAALSDADMAKVGRGALVVPATAGMIVLAYNLPESGGNLKLPRDVYVGMFAGDITVWDDPRIQQANPSLKLPHRTIALVARQDSSGTTYALTRHFSAISDTWRSRNLGVGKVIDWPGNTMLARGNEGVAARIKVSADSIGYVEYGFAKRLGLPLVALQNQAGQFVKPEERSGREGLAQAARGVPGDLRFFIPDPAGAESYPLVTYSWLLLYKQYDDPRKSAALKDFVEWGLTSGQTFSADLGYIPLPEEVAHLGKQAIDGIQ